MSITYQYQNFFSLFHINTGRIVTQAIRPCLISGGHNAWILIRTVFGHSEFGIISSCQQGGGKFLICFARHFLYILFRNALTKFGTRVIRKNLKIIILIITGLEELHLGTTDTVIVSCVNVETYFLHVFYCFIQLQYGSSRIIGFQFKRLHFDKFRICRSRHQYIKLIECSVFCTIIRTWMINDVIQ